MLNECRDAEGTFSVGDLDGTLSEEVPTIDRKSNEEIRSWRHCAENLISGRVYLIKGTRRLYAYVSLLKLNGREEDCGTDVSIVRERNRRDTDWN